ncbi:hypothetical protein AB5N19_00066 [Seiridium cardinale]
MSLPERSLKSPTASVSSLSDQRNKALSKRNAPNQRGSQLVSPTAVPESNEGESSAIDNTIEYTQLDPRAQLGSQLRERKQRESISSKQGDSSENLGGLAGEVKYRDATEIPQEAPVLLFGTGNFVDPAIKAFELQESAQTYMPRFIGEGREGFALSRATASWLARNEKGQRNWSSSNLDRDAPCPVCNATREDAVRSIMDVQFAFCSSLNLKYNDCEQYTWSFGSRYVVLEKQYWSLRLDQLPPEVWAARLLRKHTTVPVPEVVAAWKEGNVAITITERAKGKPLADVWAEYSESEKESVAKQVAGFVKQWRRMKSHKISSLDGGQCPRPEHIIANEKPIYFDDESQYRDHVRRELALQGWDDLVQDLVLKLMPANLPFVFTHGNLTLENIFVVNGEVSAILGLGRAAFLPAWAESLATHFAHGPAECQWKGMLFTYIGFEGVKSFWNLWQEIRTLSLAEATGAVESGKREIMQAKLLVMVRDRERRAAKGAGFGHVQEQKDAKKGNMGETSQLAEGRIDNKANILGQELDGNLRDVIEKEKVRTNKPTKIVAISNEQIQADVIKKPRPLSNLFKQMKPSRPELQIQGQPFTPRTIAARRPSSVFQAAASTHARRVHPNGFNILENRSHGLECAFRAIHDSFRAQYPERRDDMSLYDLKAEFKDVAQSQAAETSKAYHFVEKLGKTVRSWGEEQPVPVTLRLGCILIDGREWIDSASGSILMGAKVVWITTVNEHGSMTINHSNDFRGLSPSQNMKLDPARPHIGGSGLQENAEKT